MFSMCKTKPQMEMFSHFFLSRFSNNAVLVQCSPLSKALNCGLTCCNISETWIKSISLTIRCDQWLLKCIVHFSVRDWCTTIGQNASGIHCSRKYAVHCTDCMDGWCSCSTLGQNAFGIQDINATVHFTAPIAWYCIALQCLWWVVVQWNGAQPPLAAQLAALPTLLWNSARNWSSHSALHTEL